MTDDDIEQARRWFAEELRFVARVEDPTVIDAFATVPRERFVGRRVHSKSSALEHEGLLDAARWESRRRLSRRVDRLRRTRRLNNGQPSLWAFVFDKLGIACGECVVHLGCGIGYYSAILAELVGPTGKVLAIEIDEPSGGASSRGAFALASGHRRQRRRGELRGRKRCRRRQRRSNSSLPAWLESLSPEGTAGFSYDGDERRRRHAAREAPWRDAFEARFLCPVWFYEFAGARDADVSDRLARAFARDGARSQVGSHGRACRRGHSCWLHGERWCLSRREVTGRNQRPIGFRWPSSPSVHANAIGERTVSPL